MSKIDKLKKEIEEKTGSTTFCALPWTHVATETNGSMRLCCASNTKGIVSNPKNTGTQATLDNTTITKEWNNEYYKNIRNKMLSNEEPLDCQKCFQQEKLGIISKRLWETREWLNRRLDTSFLSEIAEPPVYLDLRLGNSCNLKCVMCSPHDSSQWVKDYKNLNAETKALVDWDQETKNPFWHRNKPFIHDLYKLIPTLEQVQFAGGEPLMIPEHFNLLNEIINEGRSHHVVLKYNTNGTIVNDEILDIWKNFKKVKVSISLDGIEGRGEYIRHPMAWEQIKENLQILDKSPENIDVNLAVTVQLLNIKHLPDFAKWKIAQKFKKINLEIIEGYQIGAGIFNMHLLYIPTFLSIQCLPEQDKKEVEESFLQFKKWLKDNYNQSFWHNPVGWQKWQSLLDYMYKHDGSDQIPNFQKYILNLDSIRGTDAKEIFPELSHLFL